MDSSRDSYLNLLLDRSSNEWVGALLIALFLSLALVGVHMACRRFLKLKDETAPLVGLGMIAVFVGMLIAGAYVDLAERKPALSAADGGAATGAGPARGPGGPGGGGGPGSGRGGGPGGFTTRLSSAIIDSADTDHDGALSADEAASAAAKFVKEGGKDGKDKIDREALQALIRERTRPSGGAPGAPATPAGAQLEPKAAAPSAAPASPGAPPSS